MGGVKSPGLGPGVVDMEQKEHAQESCAPPVHDRRDHGGTGLCIKDHSKGSLSFQIYPQLWLTFPLGPGDFFPKQMASASTSIHRSLSNYLYQDIGTWKSPLNECWDHWDWGGGRILSPERVLRAGLDYSLAIQSDSMLLVCLGSPLLCPLATKKDKSNLKGSTMWEQQLVYLKWKIP